LQDISILGYLTRILSYSLATFPSTLSVTSRWRYPHGTSDCTIPMCFHCCGNLACF